MKKSIICLLLVSASLLNSCKKDDPSKENSYYGKWEIKEVYSHHFTVQGNNTITTSYLHQHENVSGEVEFKRKKVERGSVDRQGSFSLTMDYITDPISMSRIRVSQSGEFGWMLPTYRKTISIEQFNKNTKSLGVGAEYVASFVIKEFTKNRLELTTAISFAGNSQLINGIVLER
jgi:hypothetical protein